jgi:RHS repeat-associated protein
VLFTVSDKKYEYNGRSEVYDYYNADVVNATDYYPFGMMMPGRTYSAQTGYRYGFNGKENDNEVKGEGNQQDYGMRVYDSRVGRFLSVDPITTKYPELTPYQFASNSPISNIDIDGLERGSAISAGFSNGLNRYADEKKQQANGAYRYFSSWEPYRNAWNYIKDVGKTATGDQAAIHRVAEKTTKAASNFSFSLANSLSDPAVFLSTMDKRTVKENVAGVTYYTLKGLEVYAVFEIPEVLRTNERIPIYLENPMPGTLSNVEARNWYLAREGDIPSSLNKKLPLEQQAKQAVNLRNEIRTRARELMADRAEAARLNAEEPNMTWEQVVKKYKAQGYTGDNLWNKIIESSQKSRASVNENLNVKAPKKP